MCVSCMISTLKVSYNAREGRVCVHYGKTAYACTAHIMYMCNSCAHITTTFPHPAPFSVLVTAYIYIYIYLKHGVLKLLFIVDANSFTFRAHTDTHTHTYNEKLFLAEIMSLGTGQRPIMYNLRH